jgi:hypothetical protein
MNRAPYAPLSRDHRQGRSDAEAMPDQGAARAERASRNLSLCGHPDIATHVATAAWLDEFDEGARQRWAGWPF